MKHLAFNTLQGKYGYINNEDDYDPEKTRTYHFLGGIPDDFKPLLQVRDNIFLTLIQGQTPQTILHNNNCPIDDQSKIQCPQTHEISRHPVLNHAGNGHQHSHRYHCRGYECRPPVPQQQ